MLHASSIIYFGRKFKPIAIKHYYKYCIVFICYVERDRFIVKIIIMQDQNQKVGCVFIGSRDVSVLK